MNNEDKTKAQLIHEVSELRQEVLELQSTKIELKRAEEELANHRRLLTKMVIARTAKLTEANKQLQQEIGERKQAQMELQQHLHELTLLNRAGRLFTSTLNLNEVLTSVLEMVRNLLQVTSWSAWLVDPESGDLVCEQVTDPQADVVRGWRLSPGEGVAGWVVENGESLIVSDTRTDVRHYKAVDKSIGVEMRSILSVPLRVKQRTVGALQVVDTAPNRFSSADLRLLEPLASVAAIAIENAQLYEQARRSVSLDTHFEEKPNVDLLQ